MESFVPPPFQKVDATLEEALRGGFEVSLEGDIKSWHFVDVRSGDMLPLPVWIRQLIVRFHEPGNSLQPAYYLSAPNLSGNKRRSTWRVTRPLSGEEMHEIWLRIDWDTFGDSIPFSQDFYSNRFLWICSEYIKIVMDCEERASTWIPGKPMFIRIASEFGFRGKKRQFLQEVLQECMEHSLLTIATAFYMRCDISDFRINWNALLPYLREPPEFLKNMSCDE